MKRTVWALLVLLASAAGVEAQEGSEEEYFRAVAEFFDVPDSEVAILRDRGLPSDELPVVFFVARRAGVSAEALVALRRAGQGWTALIRRYGVGADALHVPIPDDADAGRLASAYADFRGQPVSGWSGIVLSDADIVTLVNVRLLSETLDLPPAEVLRRAGASGSFAARFMSFIR